MTHQLHWNNCAGCMHESSLLSRCPSYQNKSHSLKYLLPLALQSAVGFGLSNNASVWNIITTFCAGDLKSWERVAVPRYIPIYIQRNETSQGLFISGNCSKCFGWYLHPSSGAHTTVSTASGICHTVTATCRYRGGVGTAVGWRYHSKHVEQFPHIINCVMLHLVGYKRNGIYLRCTDP
jgi:hypothetical protein